VVEEEGRDNAYVRVEADATGLDEDEDKEEDDLSMEEEEEVEEEDLVVEEEEE
jgi:hypothetical protein